MDYDRLALFLAGYTTSGFRRSLRTSPQATFTKCGFSPGEAALLTASLAKHAKTLSTHEVEKIRFAYQQIGWTYNYGGKSASDDWSSGC